VTIKKQEFTGCAIQCAFVEPGTKLSDIPESAWLPLYDKIGGRLPFFFSKWMAEEFIYRGFYHEGKESQLKKRIVKVKATIEHP